MPLTLTRLGIGMNSMLSMSDKLPTEYVYRHKDLFHGYTIPRFYVHLVWKLCSAATEIYGTRKGNLLWHGGK